MTKEEMFKEMEKMAPVLERNGVDIVLGKRIPGSFTRGYFFNEEAGLWEVYSCGERNEYFVRKQTGSEQEAVEELYQIAKYEYESALRHLECALPGFVDSKNEEKTERNAGYLVVSHSGGGMLRQGTRKGIRRTPANRGMRAHRIVKSLDISEDVCHGLCP